MLTAEDLAAIAALLDAKLEPVLARMTKLEHAVLKLEQRTGALDKHLLQVRKRLDLLSTDIMTGRTRDTERLSELEQRIDALEEQLRYPPPIG